MGNYQPILNTWQQLLKFLMLQATFTFFYSYKAFQNNSVIAQTRFCNCQPIQDPVGQDYKILRAFLYTFSLTTRSLAVKKYTNTSSFMWVLEVQAWVVTCTVSILPTEASYCLHKGTSPYEKYHSSVKTQMFASQQLSCKGTK